MTVEVLSGPERRRRWSSEQKSALVSETAQAGASVAEIARRHGISRGLLYKWRREAMEAGDVGPGLPELVPVVVAEGVRERMREEPRKSAAHAGGTIEIALPGAVRVRVCGRIEERTLRTVLTALRSA